MSLLLALVLASAACSKKRPNVVLVTFDTTRWDHVGYAGGPKGITPMLDAMAWRGTWFSTSLSAQPLTVPSHSSILTGLYPYRHGVRNNGTYLLAPEQTTLAERLQEAGYATHAVVSAFVLDSQFGLDQGFDSYDDDLAAGPKKKMFMFQEVPASETAIRAVRWLERERPRDRPFFLWIHFFDPHADYEPPPEVAAKFPGDPYSGEIHYADRELGRVLKSLDEERLLDSTLFVFTADHGDSLGEHGERTHGMFVYESTTRVPLLFAGPGVPARGRSDRLVRSVDIVPTVLDLAGVPPPDGSGAFDGASLRPILEGKVEPGREAYLETFNPRLSFGWSELRALRGESTKVILAPRPEAFDLESDPGEARNLLADGVDPDSAHRRQFATVRALAAADPFTRGEQGERAMDRETREKLAALGYLSAPSTPLTGELPDPKDRLVFWRRFEQAQAMIRAKDYSSAVATIEALLLEDPRNVVARGSLANALIRLDQKDRAAAIYREMIAMNPDMDSPYLGAAALHRGRGEFVESETLLHALLERQPRNTDAMTALGDTHLEAGRFGEAERWFRQALTTDPHFSPAAAGLGNGLNRAGRIAEAREVLAAAHQGDPKSLAVAYNLGVVTEKLGDTEGAMALYRHVLDLEPEHSMSWNNLGSLLNRLGRKDEAMASLRKAHDIDPDNVEATYNVAAMLLGRGEAAAALPLLEEACQRKPELTEAHLARGRALRLLGRHTEALATFRPLAARLPVAWLEVARSEVALGRAPAAREALAQWLRVGGERARRVAEGDPALARLLSKE